MSEVNLRAVRPYGDTLDDGIVQIAFTLPLPFGEEAKEAAKRWLLAAGFQEANVVHAADIGEGFSFFVAYARSAAAVDYTAITANKLSAARMEKHDIERRIREEAGRKLVIVGACIESDAHTVGIDAIMNMKGYAGHKGLESYQGIEAYNLGAQVACEDLLDEAAKVSADAILISQVVTQKDIHLRNLNRMLNVLESEGLRERFILICGGPRLNHELAKGLGYDAGFGPDTVAEDVAGFVLDAVLRREGLRAAKG